MTRGFPAGSSPPVGEELQAAVAHYRNKQRGRPAPEDITAPGSGQESVWDYPRPPRVERVAEPIRVEFAGVSVADSRWALRVVETAGAPVYYLPPEDVATDFLEPAEGWSLCEWKGIARYWDVVAGARRAKSAAWSYPDPLTDLGCGYERLRDYLAFYPGRVDACWLGDERVQSQPGGFYGGWVTRSIVGPMKGVPGSEGW